MNYTFYGLVTEVKRQVLSTDNNVVMTVASIVAAIFACFAIVSITKEIVLEQSGNNWKVWRPLAILVILPMFNNIVLFVDDITTNIADAIWNGVSNDKDNYDAMYASMVAKVESITSSDDWMGSLQNALSSSVSVEGLTGDSNVAGEAYADNASNSNDDVPWYKAIWNRITGWASEVQGFVIKSTGNLLSFIVSFMMVHPCRRFWRLSDGHRHPGAACPCNLIDTDLRELHLAMGCQIHPGLDVDTSHIHRGFRQLQDESGHDRHLQSVQY